MNGADWSKRYPRILEAAARIKVSTVMDAEVSVLTIREFPISIPCIAAQPIILQSLVHSIC